MGVRRIIALTGEKALELFQESFALTKLVSQEFKVKPALLFDTVKKLKEHARELQLEVKSLKKELLQTQIPSLLNALSLIHSLPLLVHTFGSATLEELKECAAECIKRKPGLYLLFGSHGEKLFCFGLVSAEYRNLFSLDDLINFLTISYDFKGGKTKDSFFGSCKKVNREVLENWLLKNSIVN